MEEMFRMAVERFKAEFLQQIKPGTGLVILSANTNKREEEERAAEEAVIEIARELQRPVNLHFVGDEEKQDQEKL